MQANIKAMEEICDKLMASVVSMEAQIEEIERKEEAQRLADIKAHEDEVSALTEVIAEYKKSLEQLLSSPAVAKWHLIK